MIMCNNYEMTAAVPLALQDILASFSMLCWFYNPHALCFIEFGSVSQCSSVLFSKTRSFLREIPNKLLDSVGLTAVSQNTGCSSEVEEARIWLE